MSPPDPREGLAKDCTFQWGSSNILLQRVWVQEWVEKWDASAKHLMEGAERGPSLSLCLVLCKATVKNYRGKDRGAHESTQNKRQ